MALFPGTKLMGNYSTSLPLSVYILVKLYLGISYGLYMLYIHIHVAMVTCYNLRPISLTPQIKVDDVWFAVDCTLGAYYCDHRDKSAAFKPNFNRHFFVTTPSTFILTHWPNDTRWQLLQSNIQREELEPLIIFPSCSFSRGIRPLTWNRSIKLSKTQKSTMIELIAQPTLKIGAKLVYMGKDVGKCQEVQTNSSNLFTFNEMEI